MWDSATGQGCRPLCSPRDSQGGEAPEKCSPRLSSALSTLAAAWGSPGPALGGRGIGITSDTGALPPAQAHAPSPRVVCFQKDLCLNSPNMARTA